MKYIRRFYSYVWIYKQYFVPAILLNVLMALLSNLLPLFYRDTVNLALEGNSEKLVGSLTIIGIIMTITYFGDTLTMYISDFALIGSAARLKQDVFAHLHNLDFHFHVQKSSGKLISLFKRGEHAFLSFYDEINLWAGRVMLDFIFLIVIYSAIYPKLILITVLVFFVNAFAMYFTVKNNVTKRKVINDSEDEVNALIVDNMIAFENVKYFAQEKFEQRRLREKVKIWERDFISYAATFRVIDIVNGGIANLGMILTIIFAVIDLSNGQINTGEFVLALTFASSFYPKVRHLVYQFREIAKNHEDLKLYLGILDEEIVVEDRVKKLPPEIKEQLLDNGKGVKITFKNVTFGYHPEHPIFNNLNLEIKPGESVALVGHSGVGKTTIIKLLMRFYDIQAGEILINDINIKDIPKHDLRKLIAMVPQEAALFNNDIGFNIAYSKAEKYTEDELITASKQAYLFDFINTLPEKYQTQIGERGIKLSGGQKQRLSIARAFVADSPMIIFDEATSSLDSISEQQIQKALWELTKNRTTIIIAHRLSTIEKVDRILVFEQGRIMEEGNHKDLISREKGIYKYLWELQSSGALV